MNETRIESAARRIAINKTALLWLEEYGVKLDGRGDGLKIKINVHYAGACTGAKEATEVMESYARLSIPDVVKQAIASCKNTIQMDVEAIQEEVAQP